MKISTMRSRLHEAISLASEEKIRFVFDAIPLEISRSEFLTLEQVREVVQNAEEFIQECLEALKEEKKEDKTDEARRMKEILLVLLKDNEPQTA